MQDIVGSVRSVTDIIGEIAGASHEQSLGIEQVNEAISQMDGVTVQNTALVQELSSAITQLGEQSSLLRDTIQVFRVDNRND